MRFDLQKGFPIVKAKFTAFKTLTKELLWFLRGETNIKSLVDQNCHIWDEWSDSDGELGPVYGYQWRSWEKYTVSSSDDQIEHSDGSVTHLGAKVSIEYIDQIAKLIETLKHNPDSRRMIVTAWNVADLDHMALEPCHAFAQFYTRRATVEERLDYLYKNIAPDLVTLGYELSSDDYKIDAIMHPILNKIGVPSRCLSCKLYQRSVDMFLGEPFNIASYALLTHMVAQVVGMIPKEFIHSSGDAHLYLNHIDQVHEMLSRPAIETPAVLKLNNNIDSINDFTIDDIFLENYEHHPAIKAAVAV